VRFIHEASNDAEKGRLFAAARAGEIGVLIGSTQKMGVGVNVQARAIALHHIDCPWRPADIEQRDGRAMRQGNQNPEIGNYRYVVEGSFDAYSWQTVERKARFISQIMRGRLDVREIDDIGDTALSFAEVKALASGDPLILEKAAADAERTRLERLQRAYQRNQHALSRTITGAEARFEQAAAALPALQTAIAASADTRGDAFRMTVGDRRVTTRPEAARLIQEWVAANAGAGIPYGRSQHPLGEVGTLGGQTIDATLCASLRGQAPTLELSLRGVPVGQPASLELDLVRHDAQSLVRQLEHRIGDLPRLAERVEAAGVAAADEATRAQQSHDQPFKHADALARATARSTQITTEMQERQQPAPEATESPQGDAEVDTAELRRLTRANFPTPAQGAKTAPGSAPARRPQQPPGHDTDLSR